MIELDTNTMKDVLMNVTGSGCWDDWDIEHDGNSIIGTPVAVGVPGWYEEIFGEVKSADPTCL